MDLRGHSRYREDPYRSRCVEGSARSSKLRWRKCLSGRIVDLRGCMRPRHHPLNTEQMVPSLVPPCREGPARLLQSQVREPLYVQVSLGAIIAAYHRANVAPSRLSFLYPHSGIRELRTTSLHRTRSRNPRAHSRRGREGS